MLAAAADGALGVLALFGVNPVLHHPFGTAAVGAALARVPFVVASELFLTETARLAHLVLPARAAFEKSGHVYDLAGDVLALNAGHAAPENTLSDGEMLVALAAELDVEVPAPSSLFERARLPAGGVARGFADDRYLRTAPQRDVETVGPAFRLAIAAHIFAGGGTVWFDERLAELRPVPSATFAPQTAAELFVLDGDLVDVVAGRRSLQGLIARIDADALPDTIVIVDGLPDAPAGSFAEGEPVVIVNRLAAQRVLAQGVAS